MRSWRTCMYIHIGIPLDWQHYKAAYHEIFVRLHHGEQSGVDGGEEGGRGLGCCPVANQPYHSMTHNLVPESEIAQQLYTEKLLSCNSNWLHKSLIWKSSASQNALSCNSNWFPKSLIWKKAVLHKMRYPVIVPTVWYGKAVIHKIITILYLQEVAQQFGMEHKNPLFCTLNMESILLQ